MIELLLNPTVWFPAALLLAAAVVAATRRRLDTAAAMHRFYGVVIGVMASGHVVAIAIKLALGTLPATTSRLAIPLGFVLGVPAWWLALRPASGRTALALDVWLVAWFVALGPSAPLAVPALLSIAYRYHRRRAVGTAIVVTAAAVYLAMLIASFVVGMP